MRQVFATVICIAVIAGCASKSSYRIGASHEMSRADAERALPGRISSATAVVGNLDSPPTALHTALPAMPRDVIAKRTEGTVEAALLVDESGEVVEVTILKSPDPALSNAVLVALKQWQFAPMTASGRPTKVIMLQDIHFKVRQ